MKPMTAATRVALLLVLGCSHKGAGGPARVPVTVARAEQRAVPYEIVATGTAEPRQTVAVQSQVTGVLTHVAFREGDEVASGQVLFQIDPRPFQAALDQARAMLARDVAQAENATLEATRYAELVKQDYVTKQDYDAKRANAEALRATVRADSAAVANAKRKSTRLNSSHSQISYAVFCLKKKKNITNSSHRDPCRPIIYTVDVASPGSNTLCVRT